MISHTTATALAVFDLELAPYILGAAGIAAGIIVAGMIFLTIVRVTREVERTRREIAAYVAEGSISAEDAEKLLKPSPWWNRGGGWCGAGKGKANRAHTEA